MARAPRTTIDISSIEANLDAFQQRIDQLQATLAQQQRLATLGMVTAVIAHEFNNILTPMLSYAKVALSDKADAALKEKALQKALAGGEKLAQISQSLLGFTCGDNSTTANVEKAVAETMACLSRDLSKDGIVLTLAIPSEIWAAINAGHLQQVLMNLIINARSAMLGKPGPKRLTISAKRTKRDKIVQIDVADTGPGIDAETLPHIFEPFFSTKRNADSRGSETRDEHAPKGGTGLGLTICQDLINSAGGTIHAESKVGQGTTFSIELPAAEAVSK